MERKLTAILYADVAGYSRLTGADDEGTVETLKVHLGALKKAIEDHGGRVVNTAGDAVLAEFASVVTALKCAVEAQRDLAERNKDLPENRKLQFRAGVNLGDLVVDGDEIYGDGVNVAARLEALAVPGGICISGRVEEQVEGKLDVGFAYLGAQSVKNIKKPVNVYKVLLDRKDAGKIIGAPKPHASGWGWTTVAVLVLVIGLGGWSAWLHVNKLDLAPASLEAMALPLPDKPSIAVLPFDNLSGDPEDRFLADGLTEDIITTLSRVPDLFVIARNSAFIYKDKPVKVQQVATELGVRYVLEGSLQRSGNRLRVTAQFIDATTGHHLWADRFDRKVDDIFALQDDIAHKILIELQVKLTSGENARVASRGTNSLEAWLLRVQALAAGSNYNKEGMLKARDLCEAAVKIDPGYARIWACLAWTHWFEARMGGWTNSRKEAMKKGIELAERAIAVDPQEPLGYIQLSYLFSVMGEYDRSIALAERAATLASNDYQSTAALALQLLWAGELERAIALFEQAKRLSPKYPAWIDWMEGLAQVMAGQPEDAIKNLQRGAERAPKAFLGRGRLVVGYAALDRLDEAKSETAELLKLKPGLTVSTFVEMHPFKDPAHKELLRELLIKAGLPE
jgi:adenylate cyclase